MDNHNRMPDINRAERAEEELRKFQGDGGPLRRYIQERIDAYNAQRQADRDHALLVEFLKWLHGERTGENLAETASEFLAQKAGKVADTP